MAGLIGIQPKCL